jgi:hypothetical protein
LKFMFISLAGAPADRVRDRVRRRTREVIKSRANLWRGRALG